MEVKIFHIISEKYRNGRRRAVIREQMEKLRTKVEEPEDMEKVA